MQNAPPNVGQKVSFCTLLASVERVIVQVETERSPLVTETYNLVYRHYNGLNSVNLTVFGL